MLQSRLLANTVDFLPGQHILFLNSAADPFVPVAAAFTHANLPHTGEIVLAEDNISALTTATQAVERLLSALPASPTLRHVAFHEYISQEPAATIDIAILNLLYQPGNSWVRYGLQVAAHALKEGGQLYVVGAKDRGILSTAKRMKECFGNVETLAISKGMRVVCSRKESSSKERASEERARVGARPTPTMDAGSAYDTDSSIVGVGLAPTLDLPPSTQNTTLVPTLDLPQIFAEGKLDEGTSLLLA